LATKRKSKRRAPLVIHRRKQAPTLPPTSRPLSAAVTCIDAAKRSGLATYVHGRLVSYFEINARDPYERRQAIRDVITMATLRHAVHGIVLEVPYGGYQTAAISLSETRALWRETLAQMFNMDRVLERTAGDWRVLLFGRHLPREQARMFEMRLAKQVIDRDLHAVPLRQRPIVGGDAAAAICIGQVMIRSRELQQVLQCGLVGI
jgi:hypothetical protein